MTITQPILDELIAAAKESPRLRMNLDLRKRTTMLIERNGMGKTNLISSMVQAMSFIFSKQRDIPQTEFNRSSDPGIRRFTVMEV